VSRHPVQPTWRHKENFHLDLLSLSYPLNTKSQPRLRNVKERKRRRLGWGTCDSHDCFFAGEIGDVDEGVIEGGENMGDAKDEFSLTDLRAETDDFFLLHNFLLRRLQEISFECYTTSIGGREAG